MVCDVFDIYLSHSIFCFIFIPAHQHHLIVYYTLPYLHDSIPTLFLCKQSWAKVRRRLPPRMGVIRVPSSHKVLCRSPCRPHKIRLLRRQQLLDPRRVPCRPLTPCSGSPARLEHPQRRLRRLQIHQLLPIKPMCSAVSTWNCWLVATSVLRVKGQVVVRVNGNVMYESVFVLETIHRQ